MITPLTNNSAANAATAGQTTGEPTSKQTSALATNADFETFLKMLTTQLKNQDPMNPMEGSEFAVQLATFSGVEQQAYTNKLLEQLAVQGSAGGLTQFSGWIGKEAKTSAPTQFGDQPITLDISPKTGADSVTLIAKDAAGREVTREEIGPGAGEIDWFGRDAQGNKLTSGLYSFHIESRAKGELIGQSDVPVYAKVTAVETTPEGARLVLAGGGTALASDVTAIREPASD